ncbi:cytochrome b5-like isoform X1 [Hermetia illucens]|uniref:cytochrome b5-like isoform X1 n=1 Tax=Hermetia illucens TaxID=343691 RepID=UPI0018CC5C3C|nr:cytochrome b5-like isoform X1 [Hermetia illucens]
MSGPKLITLTEVKEHNKPDDLWCIINGKVYDLSKFRHEHPGGSEVLEDVAGKDATTEFIEVGHSKEAENQMQSYLVGNFSAEEKRDSKCYIIHFVGAVLAGIGIAFLIKRFAKCK